MSFFGGGTDYPAWFEKNGGAVLATTIDKYCYISCRKLPPFFEHKHRIVYSKIENVVNEDEIEHPAARNILKWSKIPHGLEIHHDGDLPARSGLGSSSSFTVGLLHALQALQSKIISKHELAKTAIYVEQKLIGETVGCQDQICAAFGGFNRIDFHQNGEFDVHPLIVPSCRLNELKKHLLLVFTGLSRTANVIAREKIANFSERETDVRTIRQFVDEAISILENPKQPIGDFGKLLHQSWIHKRNLANSVSSPFIDEIYERARSNGAIGGKLLGAGGGGFMLLFAKPNDHRKIIDSLASMITVEFDFERDGSRVALYQPEGL